MVKEVKKIGADAVQAAALGHNKITKENELTFIKKDLEFVRKIERLNDERKANLRAAKDAGMKKMSIRATTKEIMMSGEQRQSIAEVADEKARYLQACIEEGIFVPFKDEANGDKAA